MSSPFLKQLLNKAKFTRIRTFLKPHMFYSDSCGRGINHSGERFQNKAVSVSGFTFFRVEGRSILVKKVCGFKNIRLRAEVAFDLGQTSNFS